jgi:hypothetical protein
VYEYVLDRLKHGGLNKQRATKLLIQLHIKNLTNSSLYFTLFTQDIIQVHINNLHKNIKTLLKDNGGISSKIKPHELKILLFIYFNDSNDIINKSAIVDTKIFKNQLNYIKKKIQKINFEHVYDFILTTKYDATRESFEYIPYTAFLNLLEQ